MLEARSVSVSRVQYAGSILAPHNVHTQPVTAEGARDGAWHERGEPRGNLLPVHDASARGAS